MTEHTFPFPLPILLDMTAGSTPRQKAPGEQALYAATVRRFLDTSRVYLALHYIGSRRWYPSSAVFSMPSARQPGPAPRLSRQGEKHVVG